MLSFGLFQLPEGYEVNAVLDLLALVCANEIDFSVTDELG